MRLDTTRYGSTGAGGGRGIPMLLTAALAFALPIAAQAQVGGTWRAEGPSPNTDGQTENVVPDDEVSGAIQTVVPHPINANIMWIGAVNGGIWRTDNATASSPTWTRQTDAQRSLSVGAMDLDSTDTSNNTLVAGLGIFSSLGFDKGGDRPGLLRTTNGGSSWNLTGAQLAGSNISGVIARGNIIVAAANFAVPNTFARVGIFRSTDGGSSFTQISGGNGSATGLPDCQAIDLTGDPVNRDVLYVSTRFAEINGGVNGIYRSSDTGATWQRVSNSTIESFMASSSALGLAEIAVGLSNNVFVGIPTNGGLSALFRSGNGGSTWSRLDTPPIHPSGQGFLHMSIAADPTNSNIVYVGGDAQDLTQFPNPLGALDFSGNLWRCNAGVGGGQCTHITHSNTLSSSAPHADSREMAFDAQGTLIETDDGGIYKRTSPRSSNGDWFSIVGNLATTEFHDIAYDSNSNTILGGAQDTGTPAQPSAGAARWFSVSTADGGDVQVDDTSTPGRAIRYSSFQNLGGWRRQTRDSANNLLSEEFATFTVVSGPSLIVTFAQPYELNLVDPSRLILPAFSATYESFDRGDTLSSISTAATTTNDRIGAAPVAYGARNNANIVYVGANPDRVFVRTSGTGSLVQSTSFPGTGSGRFIIDVKLDPANGNEAFVADEERVFRTTNAGGSWSDITGNLGSFDGGFLRAAAFIEGSNDALAVGADRGVFVAFRSSGFATWQRLGSALPNAPVFDLDYDAADDILIAGLLGRGAFSLENPLGGDPAPVVTITAPADGSTFDVGQTIDFTGSAIDSPEGDISNRIAWRADGSQFGTGANASIATLAPGAHTITATATDNAGQATTAAITVNVRQVGGSGCLFDAGFTSGTDGFVFIDDPQTPAFADGTAAGGALSVTLGGVDNTTVTDMTGAWRRTCSNDASRDVTVIVRASLAQDSDYENDEFSELRLRVNGQATVLASLTGDGNGGVDPTTGLLTFTESFTLPVGTNTVEVECFNNKKTFNNEVTTCSIDNVSVDGQSGNQAPTVIISSPPDGSTFDQGANITFSGSATDPEDGDRSATIVWRADGTQFGSGATASIATLAVGAHTITATAADTQGLTGQASITVTVQVVGGAVIIDADFDVDTDGFVYQDDPFFGTDQPAFADGERVPDGFTGSALQVTVGGIDNTTVNNMSGGFRRGFSLSSPQQLALTFRYNLTQQSDYESDELTDAIVTLDGQTLSGDQPGIIARLTGNGNGGAVQTTGWVELSIDLGTVAAGNHSLIFGIFNNKKTFNNESSDVRYDDVLLSGGGGGGEICPSVLLSPAQGSTVTGTTVILNWSECSQSGGHALHVGTFLGGADLANPSLSATDTSFTLNNLPGAGATVFVRVWTFVGSWQSTDSTFISQ